MKTAIYCLYQRRELQQMRTFISQVRPVLSDRCCLHILINDEDCPHLRAIAGACSPYIFIHCEGTNLGVAGGRNLLIQRSIAAGAEFLISCDIDIIYEEKYFEQLSAAYEILRQRDPFVGFIQPLLLDGRKVRGCFPRLRSAKGWQDINDAIDDIPRDWRTRLWHTVVAQLGLDKALGTIYHAGVINMWYGHFGMPIDKRLPRPWLNECWDKTFRTRSTTFRGDEGLLKEIILDSRPLRITSTAGGISAFHKSVFDAVGSYDEIFNPFGYEDSEMGYRSTLRGYHNYLIPNVVAIHDVFMGESNRTLMSFARLGLLRGVELADQKLDEDAFSYALLQSLMFTWHTFLADFSREVCAGRLAENEAERKFGDFALSYGYDLVRGMLHVLARETLDEKPQRHSLMDLLHGFVRGGAEVAALDIPLGLGARLRLGPVTARRREHQGSSIYSIYAANCRIEESLGEAVLNSRYFDFSCVIHPEDERRYRLTLDVLSDDMEKSVYMSILKTPTDAAHSEGGLRCERFVVKSKRYEYGSFSIEDIYPMPNLGDSQSWLPLIRTYLNRLVDRPNFPFVRHLAKGLMQYLGGIPATPSAGTVMVGGDRDTQTASAGVLPVTSPAIGVTAEVEAVQKRMRILLFADSRGQHKPSGSAYPIFGERLAADPRFQVELFLCPMKWTTTLDFLESFSTAQLAEYDHVLLYTGIVDWSPRKLSSAIHDLYNNVTLCNEKNLRLNTHDYSRKIVNNKKKIFDEVFGKDFMEKHFSAPFETVYDGEKTVNMYSLEMARSCLIPRLREIPNLIFITANRFVGGWNGDYRRQRPANIALTHLYSDLFAEQLPLNRVIDLRQWSKDDVQVYTTDNLHLTQAGSDFVYELIIQKIGAPRAKTPNSQRKAELVAESAASPGGLSFCTANALYRESRFSEALAAYVDLAETEVPMGLRFLYEGNAVEAYRKAMLKGQSISCELTAAIEKMIANASRR